MTEVDYTQNCLVGGDVKLTSMSDTVISPSIRKAPVGKAGNDGFILGGSGWLGMRSEYFWLKVASRGCCPSYPCQDRTKVVGAFGLGFLFMTAVVGQAFVRITKNRFHERGAEYEIPLEDQRDAL